MSINYLVMIAVFVLCLLVIAQWVVIRKLMHQVKQQGRGIQHLEKQIFAEVDTELEMTPEELEVQLQEEIEDIETIEKIEELEELEEQVYQDKLEEDDRV